MPRRTTHRLSWSPEAQGYRIASGQGEIRLEPVSGSPAWQAWLESVASFAFYSRSGAHCTVRKERLRRGGAYWYAYRSIRGRTHKRYLGRTADLTPERLEQACAQLAAGQSPQSHAASDAPARAPLLETKLHPPRLTPRLVARGRLLALLDAAPDHRLTLLQAPAGFGKTTLINQWLTHQRDRAAAAQRPPATASWIALDRGDNDPARFWAYMIAACQRFDPLLGRGALPYLSLAAPLPFTQSPLETALTILINDLARSACEGWLILEDYHLITHPRIHETVAFFVERLPAGIHIVILTRTEPELPLARWRAGGGLLELDTAQLRFSPEEAAAFVREEIPGISQAAAGRLTSRLEGWAAGLRLLALSMRGQPAGRPAEEYLAQLRDGAADTRPQRSIQAYFISEVLGSQPEPLQLFLLQTSVLSPLTGSLCDAVTGRQDSAGWLELAERSGFFLEPLDGAGAWYRYHALFAEAMRVEAGRRLGEAELRRLLLRASRWYATHAMPAEAVEAALAAWAYEEAAQQIERLDDGIPFSEHHTMRRWLKQIPANLLQARPGLCFRYAQALLFSEDIDGGPIEAERIEALLQLAEQGWELQGDLARVGVVHAFRVTLALFQGLYEPAIAHAHRAFRSFPQPGARLDGLRPAWADWRSICLIALGVEAIQAGAFEQARQLMLEAYAHGANRVDRMFSHIIRKALGDISAELGRLDEAAEYYQQTLAQLGAHPDAGDEIMEALCSLGLAWVAYHRNDLERAAQLTGVVSLAGSQEHYWVEEILAGRGLLHQLVQHARGEHAAARRQLGALLVRLQGSSSAGAQRIIPDVLIWQARLQIQEGDLAAAEHTLATLGRLAPELPPVHQEARELLCAHLLLAQGAADPALVLLERLLPSVLGRRHALRAFEIQLLIALAHAAAQREDLARRQLADLLAQTCGERLVRLFLSQGEPFIALLRALAPRLRQPLRPYAQVLLGASTGAPMAHAGVQGTPAHEPLTAQELRVLKLLVAGHTNPEIAQALVISVNTVKGHVKNLYRKLNVASRIQAGEVSRRLSLL